MDTSKLLEYLSVCIDLEKSKYVQERTYNSLNQEIAKYKNEYQYNCNSNNGEVMPADDAYQNKKENNSGCGCLLMILLAYVFGQAGVALSFVLFEDSFIYMLLGLLGAVLGVCIGLLIDKAIYNARINSKEYKDKESREEIERIERIESERKAIRVRIAERTERNNQIVSIVSSLEAEKKNIADTHKITTQTLKDAYSKNIIPEKYRSIVPVCMFYDYLLNRRTYSLERNPNNTDVGAINMYEDECFKKLILNKLDVVIQRLDTISANQRVLYDAIQDGNRKTHRLLKEINGNVTDVNENLKTIQYQNEEQIRCLKYSNYLQSVAYYDRYI